jgi:hypothetical protein
MSVRKSCNKLNRNVSEQPPGHANLGLGPEGKQAGKEWTLEKRALRSSIPQNPHMGRRHDCSPEPTKKGLLNLASVHLFHTVDNSLKANTIMPSMISQNSCRALYLSGLVGLERIPLRQGLQLSSFVGVPAADMHGWAGGRGACTTKTKGKPSFTFSTLLIPLRSCTTF